MHNPEARRVLVEAYLQDAADSGSLSLQVASDVACMSDGVLLKAVEDLADCTLSDSAHARKALKMCRTLETRSAAELLVEAYLAGEHGQSVAWEDVDRAHARAREEVPTGVIEAMRQAVATRMDTQGSC